MGLEGLSWTIVLNSGLPPQRLSSDTQQEHQDPVSHVAQKKREGEKKKLKKIKVIKIKNFKNIKKNLKSNFKKKERREQPNQ